MIQTILGRLAAGESLSMDEMAAAMDAVMDGQCSDGEIGLLLTALHEKGETFEEIAGAAQALRKRMTPIRSRRTGIIDTCGTGGDASGTFNVSTAAAIVTAAAGLPVAKHGNHSITSRSGSADALAALGVNIQANVATVERCLDELGICFCFAPLLHLSMKQVAPVRQKLATPTIFNLLGPLTNPAGAEYQLLGVGRAELRPLMARALGLLGIRRAIVVRGEDGLDELTIAGPTRVTEVTRTGEREFTWTPSDFGLQLGEIEDLQVAGPEESAAMIRGVLTGQHSAARDIVVLNAAAALWTAGQAENPQSAAEKAAEAIDSGHASKLLADLAQLTNG